MRNTDFNFGRSSPGEQSEDWKDSDEASGSEKSEKANKKLRTKDVGAIQRDAIVISERSVGQARPLGIESGQGTAEGTEDDEIDSNDPSIRKQKIRRSNNKTKRTRLE